MPVHGSRREAAKLLRDFVPAKPLNPPVSGITRTSDWRPTEALSLNLLFWTIVGPPQYQRVAR